MCFYLSNNNRFLKNHSFENFNGAFSSVFNITSKNNPIIKTLPIIPQIIDDDSYRICFSTSNPSSALEIEGDLMIWKNTDILLLDIVNCFNWIELLNNRSEKISFILKDDDFFYVYCNVSGGLFYETTTMTISTKPFAHASLLTPNNVYMIDFEQKEFLNLKGK